MTFLTPIWLLLLLPIAALAAAYVVVLRRRQRYAVRFASLPMLEPSCPAARAGAGTSPAP
jgi:Ca-activated chloride channel family protein